ncbi:DUF2497 domain-containing protein [Algimonas porphyrae]|uniref:DUF2497 domain-containing protein n=1 Tax=Algimonas porphyrae TaxID=1128113 RepID=A0ABQ5V198_9PROT|nr:DUF2497 domain-containing protein [Algimonas porphyrae]GLQ21333.1 hypothetical protein GCM10007854_22880 [Algimonas porphyrae]
MSEPTPESATSAMDDDAMGGLGSDAAGDEPSMEDILASIRKIIADDSDPVPLDGPAHDGPAMAEATGALRPAPVAAPTAASAPAPMDAEPLELSVTADLADADADELDIEALLSDIQVAQPETPPSTSAMDDMGDVPAFTAASPAPGMDDELSIPDAPADAAPTDALLEAGEDDVDRLMDELLSEMGDLPTGSMATAETQAEATSGNADAAELATSLPAMTFDADGDDELDLVKTLMADLTDDDEAETPDMLAVDTVVEADGALQPDVAESIEAPDVDILDSILDMTLADEIAMGPDAASTVKAAEAADPVAQTDDQAEAADLLSATIETVAVTAVMQTVDVQPVPDADASTPSLADIANAAEADVDTDVAGSDVSEIDVANIDAAMDDDAIAEAVAMLSGDDAPESAEDMDMAPAADQPTQSDPSPDETPELETSMPRAVRSDAILDDVTEEATMSAFAQLNQVVEDKAILTERGPRIGDLVQDALKPMLKEWLDENLQAIVERAVAKEVKRLSNGK